MASRTLDKALFVTGATGYIGGRLVPRLLDNGYRVRCLARSPRKLTSRSWIDHPNLEVVAGDADDLEQLTTSMQGCRAAYYLIHSMVAAGSEYRERDKQLAITFAHAAGDAGLARIIYLGGLGETGHGLSDHLSSRREVEETLAGGPVPVTVLRAAMIIGSGSGSFEILRYLVERLPVMTTPRWVSTECQPIAIRNALQYLIDCLDCEETTGKTLDIGGPEILKYADILQLTASALGLRKRVIIPVPVLTPKLSSLWIHLVTPISQHLARPLAEGLRNRVVCRDDEAARLMPQHLLPVDEAVGLALGNSDRGVVESTWMDAGPIPWDPDWAGGVLYTDERSMVVAAAPGDVFSAVCRVGGKQGWYSAGWLWRLRGFMDRLAGGPGLGRGRRRPDRVEYGDVLDFWRVTGLEAGRRLELHAEMKLPGQATLTFEVESAPRHNDCTRLRQIARFKPKGLAGLLYWFSIKPIHGFVFSRMLSGIKTNAESTTTI
jgi:uncharacterized protein YbjT (DUF2867 family)